MLYYLHYFKDWSIFFNLFRYVSFRAVCAAITAFLICLILGPRVIRYLKANGACEDTNKKDSEELVRLHNGKNGTPTMGGILIILAIVCSTLLWANPSCFYIQVLLITGVILGLIGFYDDYIKVKKKLKNGMKGKVKLLAQIIVGISVGFLLYSFGIGSSQEEIFNSRLISNSLYFPFFKNIVINLGILYIFWVMLVITASSNAVNLTDGLDGLAIGVVGMVSLSFMIIAYVVGRTDFSHYLNLPYVAGGGEIAIFCAALLGASMGFLWFNCHPAQIFMGDTGALALGGILGLVAVIIHHEILLIVLGGIFVVEAMSVILQVGSYKLKRRRIFKCAPLHHHLELNGWPETKITIRLWLIGAILVFIALSTLKLR